MSPTQMAIPSPKCCESFMDVSCSAYWVCIVFFLLKKIVGKQNKTSSEHFALVNKVKEFCNTVLTPEVDQTQLLFFLEKKRVKKSRNRFFVILKKGKHDQKKKGEVYKHWC